MNDFSPSYCKLVCVKILFLCIMGTSSAQTINNINVDYVSDSSFIIPHVSPPYTYEVRRNKPWQGYFMRPKYNGREDLFLV